MERVTGTRGCVVHFFKDGFRRCGIMDGHLKVGFAFIKVFFFGFLGGLVKEGEIS